MIFFGYFTIIVNAIQKGFIQLRRCEKGILEKLFLLKFLESYSYFALSQILVLYLHYEFGFSDAAAGTIYGAWGLGIMIAGFCLAPLNDGFGVRKALQSGSLISAFSYTVLTFCTSRTTILIILCLVLPIGSSLGIPMLTIGIKKVTDKDNRGFAFALFYTIMNVAAFVTGPIVDAFNVGRESNEKVPGTAYTGNRFVIMTCIFCSLTSFLVVTYGLGEKQLMDYCEDDNNNNNNSNNERERVIESESERNEAGRGSEIEKENDVAPTSPSSTIDSELMTHMTSSRSDPSHIKEKEKEKEKLSVNGKPEYKFLIDSDVGNEDIDNEHGYGYEHSSKRDDDVVNPLQIDGDVNRVGDINLNGDTEIGGTEGEKDEEIEKAEEGDSIIKAYSYKNLLSLTRSSTFWRYVALTLFLINLKSIFRHLDATLPTYLVRQHGNNIPKGLLYSLNPAIIMILTPLIGALLTKVPHFDMIKYGGYITGISPFALAVSSSLSAAICMIVILSIGEAIWSPRVYDYAMSVAPAKKEATFGALSAAPIFVAKLPVGFLSGYLLQTYMPEDEEKERQPQMMWLIIGLLTISSPIAITVFEKCIREPEKGRERSKERVRVDGEETEYELIESPLSPLHEQNHDYNHNHNHSHSRGQLREREKMGEWGRDV